MGKNHETEKLQAEKDTIAADRAKLEQLFLKEEMEIRKVVDEERQKFEQELKEKERMLQKAKEEEEKWELERQKEKLMEEKLKAEAEKERKLREQEKKKAEEEKLKKLELSLTQQERDKMKLDERLLTVIKEMAE